MGYLLSQSRYSFNRSTKRFFLTSILSFLLLTTLLFCQSTKPLGVVLPPTVMGNVSDSRRQILLNTLEDELSKNFNTSPSKQTGVSKLEVVENTFQLQIVEDEGDTQITLRWIYGEDKRVESKICGGCRTIELSESLKVLVCLLYTSPSPRDRG